MRKSAVLIAATMITTGVCASGASAAASASSSALTYTATDLGPGTAYDINDLSQVAGQDVAGNAALRSGGAMHDLGTLPPPYNTGSVALSVNDLGEVAGTSGDHAFGATDTCLGTLAGPARPRPRSTTWRRRRLPATKKTSCSVGHLVYVQDAFEWAAEPPLGALGGRPGQRPPDINAWCVAGEVNTDRARGRRLGTGSVDGSAEQLRSVRDQRPRPSPLRRRYQLPVPLDRRTGHERLRHLSRAHLRRGLLRGRSERSELDRRHGGRARTGLRRPGRLPARRHGNPTAASGRIHRRLCRRDQQSRRRRRNGDGPDL